MRPYPNPFLLVERLMDLADRFNDEVDLGTGTWAAAAAAILDGEGGPDSPVVCEFHRRLRAFARQSPYDAVQQFEGRIDR